jgi:hypothetical protein
MKIICNNIWTTCFATKSYRELSEQIIKHENNKIIVLNEDKKGIYYYCICGNDSLTQKNIFSLVFASDYEENNIFFLTWDKLFIISTGTELYFISTEHIKVNTSLSLFSPLIGLYITQENNLLVLEELSCKILSRTGKVVSEDYFNDVIEDFKLQDNMLFIKIDNELHTIKLIGL